MALIQVTQLQKAFQGVAVLKGVDAAIERGEVISIIGPSGSGKSTFLRCLNRLETPDGGSIIVDGLEVTSPKIDFAVLRRKMGMVFQNFNLFGNHDVLGNVMAAPCDLLGLPRAAAAHKAMELLERVGLAEKAHALPSELSGGQKQRVAIARALAMDPEILLFDEPTSALDPTMVGEVLLVIRQLVKSGMTMLIVTHEMGFAREISTRIFYMDEGRIYEEGFPDALFNRPQRPKTKAFVGRVCLREARDLLRLLREGLLADGHLDEIEVQMLLRLVEPFEHFGDEKINGIISVLRQILADGIVSAEESRQMAAILNAI